MRTFALSVGKTLLQGAVEVLLSFPLLLVIAVYLLSGTNVWAWLGTLPVLFAIGYAVNRLLPWSKLSLVYLIAIGLGFGHAVFIVGIEVPLWWLSVPVGSLVAYRGSRLIEEEWHLYFPPGFYIVGMVLYGIESLFAPRMAYLAPYVLTLLWGGLLALAVTLLMVNQSHVKQEAYATVKSSSLSVAVLWQNRLFVLGLFILVLAASSLSIIERGLVWLAQFIVYVIAAIFSLFPTPELEEPVSRERVRMPNLEHVNTDYSWWWELMQRIGLWLSIALITIAALVISYIIIKRLIRLVKWLYRWLLSIVSLQGAKGNGEGYIDDVETIVNWDELSSRWASGLKQWFRRDKGPGWGDLTDNRERIRYLYRSLLIRSIRRGYGFKSHLTPSETERDLKRWGRSVPTVEEGALVELYERVRYGREHVSDEEVARAKAAVDKK